MNKIILDNNQLAAIDKATASGLTVITGGAGTGKCLGRGTPVIMYDMTIKNVEDIRVGDILLGPNGEQKHVTSITSGYEEMFRVTPKRGGEAFACNRSHILSVLHTRKRIKDYTDNAKKYFNISVEDILTKLKPEHRDHLKCWHADCINRPEHDVPVDPYFLGVWLGDGEGGKGMIRIANSDKEIIDWLSGYADKCGLASRIRTGYFKHTCPLVEIYSPLGRVKGSNPIVNAMNELGLFGNKHIPHCFIDNNVKTRFSLLAGLIDADGFLNSGTYDIVQKSERLANDIMFLARSLGFSVSMKPCRKQCCNNGVWGDYFRITISGDIARIPCIVKRRKAQHRKSIKNPRIHGITITSIGEGEYFGFTLAEDDGLFLLGDFTVTHNTTIIKELASRLKASGHPVLLAAFAGKAAARIKEATGFEASTIHRMLGWMGDRFTCGSLQGETVIIDEASMVSSTLLAEITRRHPSRLVLVGDAAQLPPVGEGQPFHDIIRFFPQKVSYLTTCYRATEAVFKAATAIRNGGQPLMQDESEHEKWRMVSTGDARATHQYILNLAKQGYLDFSQDIVLTPRNDDEANGAAAIIPLNKDLVEIANPRDAEDDGRFKAGDRVLNTKNLPNLDIWNGTTATVMAVEPKGRLYIKTDYPVLADDGTKTTEVTVPKDEVKNFRHAYALTVHKSQGSQYRKVVFVVLQRDAFALLDRSMIYTGVTRARQECLVVGELRAFADAIRRQGTKATVFQQLAKLGA